MTSSSAAHRAHQAADGGERQRYTTMCFSPCGGVLAVAFDGGTCKLVETKEAQTVFTLQTGREVSMLKWIRVPAMANGDKADAQTRALRKICCFKSVRCFLNV